MQNNMLLAYSKQCLDGKYHHQEVRRGLYDTTEWWTVALLSFKQLCVPASSTRAEYVLLDKEYRSYDTSIII